MTPAGVQQEARKPGHYNSIILVSVCKEEREQKKHDDSLKFQLAAFQIVSTDTSESTFISVIVYKQLLASKICKLKIAI